MPKFFRSHKLFLFLAMLLLVLSAIIISPLFRSASIVTDPVWNDLFLRQEHRLFSMKKTLLIHRYLPSTAVMPAGIDAEELSEEIANLRSGMILLSPLLTKVFLEARLWENFQDNNFILLSMEAGAREMDTGNLRLFKPDGEQLAGVVSGVIRDLGDAGGKQRQVMVFREGSSWLDVETFDSFMEEFGGHFPDQAPEAVESGKINTASPETVVVFFPGRGQETGDLLEGLSQRGGRAVVVGDCFALTAWPDVVAGAVVPDMEKTLSAVLPNWGKSVENPEYTMLFSVMSGK